MNPDRSPSNKLFLICFIVENKMNHVRSSGGTAVQIRTSGSQSDPNSVGKKQPYT